MKNIVDFLKLPPRILGALSVASGLLLFLPNVIIEKLYMTSFRDKYGFAIGIVFVVSTSILVVFLVVIIAKKIKDKYYNKRLKKARVAYLKRIDGNKVELMKIIFVLPLREGEKQSHYVLKFVYGDVVSSTTYSQIEVLNIMQDEHGVTFSQSMADFLTAPKKEDENGQDEI